MKSSHDFQFVFAGNGSDTPEPPRDLVLWRYLDFPKLLDLLVTRTLKMPRASLMEDGYEGVPGGAAIDATLKSWREAKMPSYMRHASLNRELRETFFWRDRTYISCWNAFPTENAGLWRIYGDDKGVVIKTTWGKLRASLDGNWDCVDRIFYGAVDYRRFDQDATLADSYTDQFFNKRVEFVHESEFRLVAHDASVEHDYNEPDVSRHPMFATLQCDLRTLIEELIVSPRLGRWVEEVVSETCRKLGGGWKVRQSDLYVPPERESGKF